MFVLPSDRPHGESPQNANSSVDWLLWSALVFELLLVITLVSKALLIVAQPRDRGCEQQLQKDARSNAPAARIPYKICGGRRPLA
jgi:hypothetical protein